MFGLRDDTKHSTSSCTFKARRSWRAFLLRRYTSTNANVSATRYRATRNQQVVEFFDRAGRREATNRITYGVD
jgi:hypothetical protein